MADITQKLADYDGIEVVSAPKREPSHGCGGYQQVYDQLSRVRLSASRLVGGSVVELEKDIRGRVDGGEITLEELTLTPEEVDRFHKCRLEKLHISVSTGFAIQWCPVEFDAVKVHHGDNVTITFPDPSVTVT